MTADAVVVDASLVTMWAVPERHSATALALVDRWGRDNVRLLAPCLLIAEVTNALYKRVLRGELNVSTAEAALDVILAFDIDLREEPSLAHRALSLARRLRQPTTYDCHYLALAERYDCALWTGDRRFYNAAHRIEPRVQWIGVLTPGG